MRVYFEMTMTYLTSLSLSTLGIFDLLQILHVQSSVTVCTVVFFFFHQVGPTELPQTVAAFHSLVGAAATATAISELIGHPPEVGLCRFLYRHVYSLFSGPSCGSRGNGL